ncbi:aminotransferase class V-fold PLP-dependent enzyme [Frateuria aurantia]
MKTARRDACRLMAWLPALALAGGAAPVEAKQETVVRERGGMQFAVRDFEVCLDNARWHPLSKGSRAGVEAYLDYKERGIWQNADLIDRLQSGVKSEFAALVHADPSDIAYVNSTTAAETLLVASLGLPEAGSNIVTDALHFEGSLYMYGELKRQGADVRVVRPTADWRIDLNDMARMIDRDTRLVAISQISFINGFQHDIRALCDLAHAHGAIVYVDAVQAAGAVPVDVRRFDVDVLACASYKWLMGDFGLGFMYVHPRVIPRLRRVVLGYRQLTDFASHAFPGDAPGPYPASWNTHDDAAGFFEIGTYSNATLAALAYSIPAIRAVGVEHIQQHAGSLVSMLQQELPRLGYQSMTPPDMGAPIASFMVADVPKVRQRLRRASVDVSLHDEGRMRISPSIYNDRSDIERLLEALS